MKTIASNRKGYFNYEIKKELQAGIVLVGGEIKSLRSGNCDFKNAYVSVKNNEVFLKHFYIAPYQKANLFNVDPVRTRKLLLKKREINNINLLVKQQNYLIMPFSLYFKHNLVKVKIGLCLAKKKYDKRQTAKTKTASQNIKKYLD